MICGSVTKYTQQPTKTDVSLSKLSSLQIALRSEAKLLCGRALTVWLSSSYQTFTCILVFAIASSSWDDGGVTSSFVGSALVILTGRGLSGSTVRWGRIAEDLAVVLTFGTMSLEAHSRPLTSRALWLRFFHFFVFGILAVSNGCLFIVS